VPHRVLDFAAHAARNGHANGRAKVPPNGARLRGWDVDVGSLFFDERGEGVRRAQAGFRVRVDPVRCGYSVTVFRDGIDYPLILQQFMAPGETHDAAVARRAIAWFLNQCLCAAYRVSA
jgi:hypothetical protein